MMMKEDRLGRNVREKKNQGLHIVTLIEYVSSFHARNRFAHPSTAQFENERERVGAPRSNYGRFGKTKIPRRFESSNRCNRTAPFQANPTIAEKRS